MEKISTFISTYFDWFYITVPGTVDIIEILILSFFIFNYFTTLHCFKLFNGISTSILALL